MPGDLEFGEGSAVFVFLDIALYLPMSTLLQARSQNPSLKTER